MLILILSTAVLLVGLAVTAWIHSRYHLDIVVQPGLGAAEAGPSPGSPPFPKISVVVPARNEARNIRRCVEALLAQDYPDFEVIVLDDRSTDGTGGILASIERSLTNDPLEASPIGAAEGASSGARSGAPSGALSAPHSQGPAKLRTLQGAEPPPGWAGKPHALVQGAEQARGEWLCFVDADTFAAPALLSSTLAVARANRADLFTILTDQELVTFWERAILPVVFTALSFGFPARRVNDPGQPDAIANGQFILIRRPVYEAVGGHEAVKDRIAEDQALAALVKGRGYRLIVADGRVVARTRMYTSLPEIWEGWTKNIFLGMQGRLGLLLFGAVMGLVGALALPAWLIGAVLWFLATGGWIPAVVAVEAALLWAYLLWQRSRAARAFGLSPWYALTLPLGALGFTAMMFASAYKVLSGQGVTWKGRTYYQ